MGRCRCTYSQLAQDASKRRCDMTMALRTQMAQTTCTQRQVYVPRHRLGNKERWHRVTIGREGGSTLCSLA